MPTANTVNFPDILGMITGGARCNLGVVQVALAIRPHTPRSGRPFEVIVLLQNASDVDVDVTATLHLPELDAKKQKGQFLSKTRRLVVGVQPAEVGYVLLPVSTLADTAVSDGYKIAVELEVKPLAKPSRIRREDGGGAVALDSLPDSARAQIDALKPLVYATHKRLGRPILETTFGLMPGKLGQIVDFTPGWVSICKLADYQDDRLLLHRFGDLIQINTLPQLKQAIVYEPLVKATRERFGAAGYPLENVEAVLIAKLLTLLLEYASPRHTAHGHHAAGAYNVEALLERDPLTLESVPRLPHWFRALLAYAERDTRATTAIVPMLTRYLYPDLLRDGIDHAFDLVETATGEDVGSVEERVRYRDLLIQQLEDKSGLNFSSVYSPLILGGALVNERLLLAKENPADTLREMSQAVEKRCGVGGSEEDETIREMAMGIFERAGRKYGF